MKNSGTEQFNLCVGSEKKVHEFWNYRSLLKKWVCFTLSRRYWFFTQCSDILQSQIRPNCFQNLTTMSKRQKTPISSRAVYSTAKGYMYIYTNLHLQSTNWIHLTSYPTQPALYIWHQNSLKHRIKYNVDKNIRSTKTATSRTDFSL